MSENYPQFLSSMMAGAEAHARMSPEDLNHPFLAAPQLPVNAAPINYQNFGYFPGYPGQAFSFHPPVSKGRRKSSSAITTDAEQVKHRRTRSGCYTCRGRRVKCDEARPICERCRKGGRDCIYPDPSNSKGPSRQKETSSSSAPNQSPTSSHSEDVEHDDPKHSATLQTIPDEGERTDGKSTKNPPKNKLMLQISDRAPHENTSLSPSPSTAAPGEQFSPGGQGSDFRSIVEEDAHLCSLPQDYLLHLQYLYENITCHHYFLTNDVNNFFIKGMIVEASRNQLLLNAVVAFSSYLQSVQQPNAKLRDFLLYYNRSITLLLECLKQEETNNLPTLLSILQLATIEEYLGDWLNLMGHQRAALEIFTNLFTPQTVMETRIGQTCLVWYSRFDVGISLLSTTPSKLTREWYTAAISYFREKTSQEPNEIQWKVEERLWRLYIIRYDMTVLFSKAAQEEMSEMEFSQEHEKITTQLLNWRETWDPMLTSPAYAVQDFSWGPTPDPDDFIDPCEPGLLYNPPLLSSSVVSVEWHCLLILHKSLARGVPREKLVSDLVRHSYAACQMFEALELWPGTPKGVLSGFSSLLVIVAMFLPRDARHRTWLWRKLALLETMGSTQAFPFRSRLADLFHDENARRWWLPNDEGFSPILQSIRNFADERHHAAANAQLDHMQSLGCLFDKLNVEREQGL